MAADASRTLGARAGARLVRSAMRRSLEGITTKFAAAFGVLTTLVFVVLAIASGRQSSGDIDRVAPLAAEALAWGAGVLLCFAASIRAFDRDHADGWDALLARHGARPSGVLGARIVGLAAVTLLVVALGTIVAGVAGALASHDRHVALLALDGTLAGLAYAVAFSVVVAPIALATLGPRDRASGYLFLLAVLVVPALIAPWTRPLFPEGWDELVSIPNALDALRDALLGSVDGLRAVRATLVLAAVALVACLWAQAQLRFHRRATGT